MSGWLEPSFTTGSKNASLGLGVIATVAFGVQSEFRIWETLRISVFGNGDTPAYSRNSQRKGDLSDED